MDGSKHKKTMETIRCEVYTSMVCVMQFMCFPLLRRNGRPGKSFPHAQAWPRLPQRWDLQCGRRYMEAAALDGQYAVQFFGIQGLFFRRGNRFARWG